MPNQDQQVNFSKEYLMEEYVNKGRSFAQIAAEHGTYTNKIVRTARKLGIPIRSKSEAQSVVVERDGAPFQGKKHSTETKVRISEKQSQNWEDMSDEDRLRFSEAGKKYWDSLSPEKRDEFRKKSFEAVKKASIEGSKLEKVVYAALVRAGYVVTLHSKHKISNHNVHLDLLLPNDLVVIEIDGPSHFAPIWGDQSFIRAKKSDSEKDRLLIGSGYCIIRVIQHRQLSEKFKRDIVSAILTELAAIKQKFPPLHERHITVNLEEKHERAA